MKAVGEIKRGSMHSSFPGAWHFKEKKCKSDLSRIFI